ncbi:LysR family transcriptional regulator [Dyella sp. 20L07]|uniref:LysR family transcriptional regulator n=1 Tax=Dyella sp. 20L07 TaxID=3384240 RepID=UPI003D2E841C
MDLFLLTVVVEAGGFSAAARRSGTTKSRLSRRIIELENRLGARLLHRDARRFSMTPVGEQVYRHALLVREAAEAAEAVASAAKGSKGGHVRIHASDMLLPLIEDMLGEFSHQHSHTRLSIMQNEDGIHSLLACQADLVLYAAPDLPDSSDVTAHPLGQLKQVVVAHHRLLTNDRPTELPNQMPDHQLIELVNTDASDQPTGTYRRKSNPRFASNRTRSLLAAARAGIGYLRLPLYLCHDDIQKGHLQAAYPAHSVPALPLYALTLRGVTASHITHDLIQFVRKHLEKTRLPGVEPA